ncbi:MAG: hypothetical protein KC517_11825 [Bacteroidetes bacterium]|nr:hypothetical protein [Bacteroidota bacterium]
MRKYQKHLGLLFFVVVLFFCYGRFYNHLPLGVHNWAQSDRYSVAVKFLDELDFFKARTHNLSTIDGRCGVEFPATQYLSARIASLTSSKYLPTIYRTINLIILVLGLWMFVLAWDVQSFHKIIMAFLLFFSPVLLFYGYNFLPDTAGLGLLLLGMGYFIKFNQTRRLRFAFMSLAFAGLATLLKTTCGIYFLALAGTYGIHFISPLQLKKGLKVLAAFVGFAGLIFLYDYFYFHKVNTDFYSRIFMSKQQPLTSASDFRGFWKAITYWHGQYMTWPQTILIFGLIVRAITNRKQLEKNNLGRNLLLISIVGLTSFLLLMGKQFINHDYYFIAAILPLFCLTTWYFLSIQSHVKFFKSSLFTIVLTGLAIFTILQSTSLYEKRMSSHFVWKNRDIINDIEWLQDGARIIDEISIEPDDKIFVGYDAAPNTALVYFDRKGKVFNHEEMTRDSSNMQYWSNRIRPDYFIFPNMWVSKLETEQPWLYANLVPFAKRQNFVIYKPIYQLD